jgi:TetR/AcrR family transcriptional regulator, tetracycline repressor protein
MLMNMAYDVDQLARAALDLLGETGLDGLTTRRLAAELGIEGPALYHHFKNKAELLGEMATAILRESLDVTVDRGDWKQWLLDHAVNTRQTLLRYRDSARILAASAPSAAMKEEIMPAVIQPLLDAGFRKIDAYETASLVAAFTLGFVINEQNEVIRCFMSSVIHVDRGFLHGVEALIAGVESKYAGRMKMPGKRVGRTAPA